MGLQSAEVAFLLLSQVRFTAFPRNLSLDVAEIYWQHCLEHGTEALYCQLNTSSTGQWHACTTKSMTLQTFDNTNSKSVPTTIFLMTSECSRIPGGVQTRNSMIHCQHSTTLFVLTSVENDQSTAAPTNKSSKKCKSFQKCSNIKILSRA